jgi:hypothetical protein
MLVVIVEGIVLTDKSLVHFLAFELILLVKVELLDLCPKLVSDISFSALFRRSSIWLYSLYSTNILSEINNLVFEHNSE